MVARCNWGVCKLREDLNSVVLGDGLAPTGVAVWCVAMNVMLYVHLGGDS